MKNKHLFFAYIGEYINLVFDNGTSLNCDLTPYGLIKNNGYEKKDDNYWNPFYVEPEYDCRLVDHLPSRIRTSLSDTSTRLFLRQSSIILLILCTLLVY